LSVSHSTPPSSRAMSWSSRGRSEVMGQP
jgi:hypothetical protein